MEFKSQNKLLLLVWTREHECLIVLETHENYSSAIFESCYRKQPLKSRFYVKILLFTTTKLQKKPCFLQKYIYFVKILLSYVKKLFFYAGLFLKYPSNFANLSLYILTKYIFIEKISVSIIELADVLGDII